MQSYLWWRDGVIYQIYPRSFYDTHADGLGDLPGIIAKLDYIAQLGVDAIWLSPFYPSPDADFGYDISDHCEVDHRFGTLADFDKLLEEAHRRDIRVVLDMVLNHTSNQHPWFIESRRSPDSPQRDWYFWRDQKPGGKPPNNWQSVFGGGAWETDPASGQAYLHLFVKEQPDVNWRNAALRQAQLDVVRFWLARGADGFRLDVFNAYFKDENLRDNPKSLLPLPVIGTRHVNDIDQPEMMPLLKELRGILDQYPDRYAVGETFFASAEKAASYCGQELLHAVFSFEFTGVGGFGGGRLNPGSIRRKIEQRERIFIAAGAWPTTVMGNHDVPRPASRYCRGEEDQKAKLAMALLLTLRGTPFLYYGDEIGMRDRNLRRSQILDPVGKRFWPLLRGRDGCRTPMQWDSSSQAGFTEGTPWLRVHSNSAWRNVEAQSKDPGSILSLTRRLIRLRKANPALTQGSQEFVESGSKRVLAFKRALPNQEVLVLLNFSGQKMQLQTEMTAINWRPLFSTDAGAAANNPAVLQPYEVRLLVSSNPSESDPTITR